MSNEVHEGQILAGKFRIERVLGQGGMGIVVAATHLQLDERVALKFLLPEALSNPEAVERFAREARAAVKIKSEHVARVSDVGTLESGSPYMVMEYLQGEDLAAWVRRSGAIAVPEAIEFLLQACEAIAEAHALGIVHRDLKPANLFVTRRVDGSVCIKVLDFGISKLSSPGAPEFDMTRTNTVMGSPLYMSPEQMSSTRNVDMRTDIWALGVILYESLTGRVPFEAETMPQLCGMILQDPPRPMRELRPELPVVLQEVIFRCLEKNRDHRFNNVAELAYALAPFGPSAALRSAERIARVLGAAGFPSTPMPVVGAVSMSSGSGTTTNFGASTEAKKSRGPVLVALCLLGLVLGGALLFITRRGPSLESVGEPPSAKPVSAATTLGALGNPPPIVQPQLAATLAEVSPGTAPSASAKASASASAKPTVASVHAAVLKGKSEKSKAPPQPTAAEIDPLDGRR